MFLRVKIRKEDALSFLWKDDINNTNAPNTYAIFGACCSFVAKYVQNKKGHAI